MGKVEMGMYKHFKGNYYRVLALAKHSETQEDMVVYQPLYEREEILNSNLINGYNIALENLWVRPATMFCEMVEHNGVKIKRFEKVVER